MVTPAKTAAFKGKSEVDLKRIIFCFDGTGNALSADTPTNVVLAAASINRVGTDGVSQVIYYDEGVGTAKFDGSGWVDKSAGIFDKLLGGGLGWGVTQNIRDAYRFLIFNYDPGDDLFVFGFSRGAFTARSFIGLLRCVGPIRRLHAARIDEALQLYHERVKDEGRSSESLRQFRADYSTDVLIDPGDEDWRIQNVKGYLPGSAPLMRVRYLGVWDTVSALGAPEALPGSSKVNSSFRFHDTSVTSFIDSARHAVSIDERRKLFPPVLFGDLSELNALKKIQSGATDAPYQEKWFPGVHGSVGGGGDIRGLSDGALEWILFGAKRSGLSLDISKGTRIYGINPNPFVSLVNTTKPKNDFLSLTLYQWKGDRAGPVELKNLSMSAIRRWKADGAKLPENKLYRPKTLDKVASQLSSFNLKSPTTGFELLDLHVVQQGETLYDLSRRYYHDGSKFGVIYDANADIIDDSREITVGQELRIPSLIPPN